MSVMSPEKYMELVFLCKNSIGPGAVQSAKNTIWVIFCKKQRWTLCFCLLCRFRFGTISKNMSYLRELEILHCFCFLHKHLSKWKAFANYFLLLEDLPHQLSYLCYLYSIEHGRYFTDFLDMN